MESDKNNEIVRLYQLRQIFAQTNQNSYWEILSHSSPLRALAEIDCLAIPFTIYISNKKPKRPSQF